MLSLPVLASWALLAWSVTPVAGSSPLPRAELIDRLAPSAVVETRAIVASLPFEAFARRSLEKRATCTVASQCTSPMPPFAYKMCRDGLCRTVCDAGYYFDTSSRCQLYTCVVSKCPFGPANSRRICTSKNLCSFACLSGFQLGASRTTCDPPAPAFVRASDFSQSSQASDGLKMSYGTIRSTLLWQSSGTLAIGSCAGTPAFLSTCWRLSLEATGNLQDPNVPFSSSTTATTSQKGTASSVEASTFSEGPALSLQEQAARDDENLELYHRAFPEHKSSLVKRRDCDIPGNSTTSPRQRIEFLSWPGVAAGTSWKYTWSTYLTPNVGSSSRFFHLWQIFSRDPCVPGPIVMMGVYLGNIVITDPRGRCGGRSGIACPSVPMSSFWGRTVVHTLSVTYGEFGSLSYNVVEKGKPGVSLLRYDAVGEMGGAASLKFGMYRAAEGLTTGAETFLAGYTATRVA